MDKKPEDVGAVAQLILIRLLFERCIKNNLGMEPREYFLTPSNAEAVSLYIKTALTESANNLILESRNGFQNISKFAEVYAKLIDEINMDLGKIERMVKENEHNN